MTVGGLAREVGEDADLAVDELAAVGLLARNGETVRATPAAIYFDALRLP